jgi:hypothetical protein
MEAAAAAKTTAMEPPAAKSTAMEAAAAAKTTAPAMAAAKRKCWTARGERRTERGRRQQNTEAFHFILHSCCQFRPTAEGE